MSFFNNKMPVETVVLIAALVAIASIGRIAFASIASIQLASFIIIMAGIIFGWRIGLIVGLLTPVVTDLMGMGLGSWTVFQIIGWGLMGLSAGFLAQILIKNDIIGYISRGVFGFAWGFVYGWISNISMFFFMPDMDLSSFIGICITGFSFDLTHALTNLIALTLLFELFRRIFVRAKKKFLPNISTTGITKL
ncbi:MAG: ECF transporter S component [Methanobrevibacter sp.]|jgi:energy-coupling factor transport system substrate-specific component|nr:ECF transporter S component [Methanobrevibacter sp.]